MSKIINSIYFYPSLILICVALILIFSNTIQKFVIRFIQKIYKKPSYKPIITLYCGLIINSLPLILVILVIVLVAFQLEEYKEYEFAQQIEKLNEMQNSLEDLQILISTQKERLIQTEKYIELLKTEKEKLEPIVTAKRELVESILTLQKERTMFQVWKDRFIGFLISLLAGLVIIKFKNILKLRKP